MLRAWLHNKVRSPIAVIRPQAVNGPTIFGQQLAFLLVSSVSVPELCLKHQTAGRGRTTGVLDRLRVLARIGDGFASAGRDVGVRSRKGKKRGARALDGEENGDETERSSHIEPDSMRGKATRISLYNCSRLLYSNGLSAGQYERAILPPGALKAIHMLNGAEDAHQPTIASHQTQRCRCCRRWRRRCLGCVNYEASAATQLQGDQG